MTVAGAATHAATVDRAALTFTMERVFAAPRERVFAALSTCDALTQWFAPEPWTLSACRLDFRVGGTWHYCMQGPDGTKGWGVAGRSRRSSRPSGSSRSTPSPTRRGT